MASATGERTAPPGRFVESWYEIAGLPLCARVAGRELARNLLGAFAHLARPPAAAAALTLEAWDESLDGPARPGPDWPPGTRREWPGGGGVLAAAAGGRFVGVENDHGAAWLDRRESRLRCWVRAADSLTLFETGKPCYFPLSTWLHDRGRQPVHAALVSWAGAGVLLSGPPGCGKSTCALACALDGFDFLGDDHVALEERGGGAWTGHSLFGGAWLTPGQLRRFPALAAAARAGRPPPADKLLVPMDEVLPGRLPVGVPIRALALPVLAPDAPAATIFSRVSPAEALRVLAAGAASVVPRPGATELMRLGRLAAELPAFRLELGQDIAGLSCALRALSSEAGVP